MTAYFLFLEVLFLMEKQKSKPTIRRRKNLLDCNMTDILYDAYQRVIAPNHTLGVRA
jgi:hypothetical protein